MKINFLVNDFLIVDIKVIGFYFSKYCTYYKGLKNGKVQYFDKKYCKVVL